jgi:hypothetical protein
MTSGKLIMLFSFVSGTFYNATNIYCGFIGAKDKLRALKCLIPYV